MKVKDVNTLTVLAAAIALAACDSSPTGPTATLAVSQSTVSLERTATAQVAATSTSAGVSTDITTTATWRSSNEQVATVSAGLITGVGPGTATITVEHGRVDQAVAVTVRRRVYLKGELSVIDGRGEPGSISGLLIYVDNAQVGDHVPSNRQTSLSAPFGSGSYRRVLDPGEHTLRLRIQTPFDDLSQYPFTIRPEGPVTVIDYDTEEEVGTVTLEKREGTYGDNPDVTWTFTLGAFTS